MHSVSVCVGVTIDLLPSRAGLFCSFFFFFFFFPLFSLFFFFFLFNFLIYFPCVPESTECVEVPSSPSLGFHQEHIGILLIWGLSMEEHT